MDELGLKIARLSLAPGDVLVVKAVDRIISNETAERVRLEVSKASGYDKIMVIDSTIDLSVLSAAEIAERIPT